MNQDRFDFSELAYEDTPTDPMRLVWVLFEGKLFLKILPASHIWPDGKAVVDGCIVPWFEAKEFR